MKLHLPVISDSEGPAAPPPSPPRAAGAGEPVRLLVSACLLGERVRDDGQHKRDAFVVDVVEFLRGQVFLEPFPAELALRNHT